MKIVYIPSDMDAPGCYRSLFPARHLRGLGHEVTMPEYTQWEVEENRWRTEFKIALNPPDPWGDIYVLQQPKSRMWREEGIGLARIAGMCTVIDVDDNYLELPTYNPSFKGTHPYRRKDGHIINRAERRKIQKQQGFKVAPNEYNREHMYAAMQGVDAITVSTPYLASIYEHLNPNIHVVRNFLEWDIWEDIVPQYEVERERIRIGYLASFGYRAEDLNVIRAVVGKFIKRHPEVDFVATTQSDDDGNQTWLMHDFFRIPEEQRIGIPEYIFYPGPEGEFQVGHNTAVMDIGLIPLAMNGLNEGKSHLKGMEYNAAGIPFIASPTESYRDYWCDEGENGFVVRSEKEWLDRMETLLEDEKLRRHMGKFGRSMARDNSFDRRIHEWDDTYRKILGGEAEWITRQCVTKGAVQKTTECAAMFRRAKEIEPKVVVEIGSASGGTFWGLSQVAHPEALLVSIDLVGGSPIDVRQGKDVYQMRDRDRMRTYCEPGQSVRLIDGNSQEIETVGLLRQVLEGRDIDFLFIDGDHRYDGVRTDYELYAPLVRPGGLIAFHDITVQNDPRSMVHVFWPQLRDSLTEGAWEEYIGSDNWGVGQWGGISVMIRPLVLPALPAKPRPKVMALAR